mgnify:CR=1 FL=1
MFFAIGKAKPGAAALGGEIWIEDHARQIRWVDPDATVRNDNRRAIVAASQFAA